MTKTKTRPEDPEAELAAADVEVAQIDSEIGELRDRIDGLAAERDRAVDALRRQRANRHSLMADPSGRAHPYPAEWQAEDDAAAEIQTRTQDGIAAANRQVSDLRRRRREVSDSSRQLRMRLLDLNEVGSLEPLAAGIEKAQEALDALLAEQQALPDLIAEAEAACDAVTVVEADLRARALPIEIEATQRLLKSTQKRHAEAMVSSLAEALLDSQAVVEEAEAKEAAAAIERQQCRDAHRVLLGERDRWRDKVRRLRAELKR